MTTKTRMPSIVVAALSLGVSYEAVEIFLKQEEAKRQNQHVSAQATPITQSDDASRQVPQV